MFIFIGFLLILFFQVYIEYVKRTKSFNTFDSPVLVQKLIYWSRREELFLPFFLANTKNSNDVKKNRRLQPLPCRSRFSKKKKILRTFFFFFFKKWCTQTSPSDLSACFSLDEKKIFFRHKKRTKKYSYAIVSKDDWLMKQKRILFLLLSFRARRILFPWSWWRSWVISFWQKHFPFFHFSFFFGREKKFNFNFSWKHKFWVSPILE